MVSTKSAQAVHSAEVEADAMAEKRKEEAKQIFYITRV
jgi:hypothetical protein